MRTIQESIHDTIKSLNADLIEPNLTNTTQLSLALNSEILNTVSNKNTGNEYTDVDMNKASLGFKNKRTHKKVEEIINGSNEEISQYLALKNEYVALQKAKSRSLSFKDVDKKSKNSHFNQDIMNYMDVCCRSESMVTTKFYNSFMASSRYK